MFRFEFLDKENKAEYLPALFDIFYSNMKDIMSSELGYDEEKSTFILEISNALEKEPRNIILCYMNNEIAGFLMYYTRQNLIMIEELQLIKKFQRTKLLYQLCKYMISILPQGIEFIEAFSFKSNEVSISLQRKLGMELVESQNEKFLHFRGKIKNFKSKIK